MKKLIFIFMIFVLSSCSYINQKLGMKDDNIPEEIMEKVIENQTGVSIDLTPLTPEAK